MIKVLEHLLGRSGYNKKGEEIPDPIPAALQIDLEAEMPLHEKVLRAIQSPEWSKRMQDKGRETYQEANDFNIDEELPEFKSIHEEESGDVIAYEEGVRSGFIEEIPQEKRENSRKTSRLAGEHIRKLRTRTNDKPLEGDKK